LCSPLGFRPLNRPGHPHDARPCYYFQSTFRVVIPNFFLSWLTHLLSRCRYFSRPMLRFFLRSMSFRESIVLPFGFKHQSTLKGLVFPHRKPSRLPCKRVSFQNYFLIPLFLFTYGLTSALPYVTLPYVANHHKCALILCQQKISLIFTIGDFFRSEGLSPAKTGRTLTLSRTPLGVAQGLPIQGPTIRDLPLPWPHYIIW
jgi:hypothetical protein